MGTLIGLINSAHGLLPALSAATKQGAYTFFFAGFIMQHCRWLANFNLQAYIAIALATLWPTLVTVVLVYTLHSFKGTPEPVLSCIPPGLIGFVSYFLVSRQVVSEDT